MTLGVVGGPPAYWLAGFHFQLGNELRPSDFRRRPREWSGEAPKWSFEAAKWSGGAAAGRWRGGGVEWRGGGGAATGLWLNCGV